jgi:hypothetical protein
MSLLKLFFLMVPIDCGNSLQNAGVVALEGLTGCNGLCLGNSSEYCGAGNRLDVYKLGYTGVSTTSTLGTTGRTLQHQPPDSQTNSVETCISTCISLGYRVAGMEYGSQCFCDNFVYNGAAPAAASSCKDNRVP